MRTAAPRNPKPIIENFIGYFLFIITKIYNSTNLCVTRRSMTAQWKDKICLQNKNDSIKKQLIFSLLLLLPRRGPEKVPCPFLRKDYRGWATIRPKRQFVPSDNSSQIPKSHNSSQASIRPILKRRQFVPFVKSDNSSQIV